MISDFSSFGLAEAAPCARFALTAEKLGLARGGRVLAQEMAFGLRNGEALAIEGANGAGKSSLLRLLGGLLAPHSGRLTRQGDCACHYVGHRLGLSAALSAGEHMRFWSARRLSAAEQEQAAAAVQLEGLAAQRCDQLSEGQRRRVVLLRLLLAPRALWLLDEPFVALDAEGQKLWQQAVAQHRARGGAVALAGAQKLVQVTRTLRLGKTP